MVRHFWFEWEHVELKLNLASPKQQQHERTQRCWQEKAYLWSQQAVSWAHSCLRVWSIMDTSSCPEAFMLWNLPAETNKFWIICIFWQKNHKQTNKWEKLHKVFSSPQTQANLKYDPCIADCHILSQTVTVTLPHSGRTSLSFSPPDPNIKGWFSHYAPQNGERAVIFLFQTWIPVTPGRLAIWVTLWLH